MQQLENGVFTAPQLRPDDAQKLHDAGIRAVICNRPDHEEPHQPQAAELAEALAVHDIPFYEIPVVPGQITQAQLAEFAQTLQEIGKPTLIFCRTGTRSTHLWAMVRCRELGVDAVINQAALAGYDIAPMRPLLENIAQG